MTHRTAYLALIVALLLPQLAAAQVVLERRSDGTVVITNADQPVRNQVSPRAVSGSHVPEELVAAIERTAQFQSIDPRLVRAVVHVESAFNSQAVSQKGAQGLMQLMPGTARDLGVVNAFDPEENLRGGTAYLRALLDRFGDLELALAGYNAGPEAVARYGAIPPYAETRNYVDRVLGVYRSSGGDPAEGGYATADSSTEDYRPRRSSVVLERNEVTGTWRLTTADDYTSRGVRP